MRKTYVVFGLQDKDFITSVSFFSSLDYETSYGNMILYPIKEFLDKQSAEVWCRTEGKEYVSYEGGLMVLEVFKQV
jgi:hypothetical protein